MPNASARPNPEQNLQNDRQNGLPSPTVTGGKSEQRQLAGELGFEPRLTESESAVLPLNYSPPTAQMAANVEFFNMDKSDIWVKSGTRLPKTGDADRDKFGDGIIASETGSHDEIRARGFSG